MFFVEFCLFLIKKPDQRQVETRVQVLNGFEKSLGRVLDMGKTRLGT
jgi:hypothetical protein